MNSGLAGSTGANGYRMSGAFLLSIFVLLTSAFGLSATDVAGAGKAKDRCTIKGTNGPDRLRGTGARDVICGLGGDDRIVGLGGKDLLIGGKGKDRVLGGTGDDRLLGGPGKDRLYGQPQDDTLFGGPGDDYLNGGMGSNQLSDAAGQNRCLDGAADTVAGTCDNTAPVLVSATVAPTSVDTSEEARTIEVTLRATDDLTGIQKHRVSVNLNQAATGQRLSGFPQLESGDSKDGIYTATLKLPHYAAQGRWDLSIGVGDEAGNGAEYYGKKLTGLGIPASIAQTGPGDSEMPKVLSLSLDRDTVDSSAGNQVIRATIRVTDDLSGISIDGFVNVGFVAYQRETDQFIYADVHRVSGNDTDAVYEAVMTVKKYSAKGDWELRVGALDRAGNQVLHSYLDLQRMGLPAYIHQTGAGDSTAPTVTELSVTPGNIDTTNSAQTVTLRYRMVDNLSGHSGTWNAANVSVNGVSAPYQWDVQRISGDALDGVYEGTLELPQGATQGNWTFAFGAYDDAGNGRYYGASELAAAGFPSGFHNGP